MSSKHSSGNLLVVEREGGLLYYAKWRDSTRRQTKRKLGPAWVERDGTGAWRKRRGRVGDGFLDEKAAYVQMHRLIEEHEADLAKPRPDRYPTFDEAASDWLHRLEHIDGAKPSTLADYRLMLASPDAEPRKRGRRTACRIMREFGGQELRAITTAQVESFLARLDEEDISKRTVNKHRQVVRSILEHAARQADRYGITENVASATPKRREPPPSVLDFYEPEEVAALARVAADGLHRDLSRPAVSEDEQHERRLADEQDAALYTVAAFTGLRLGELLALRWHSVSFQNRAVIVASALSGGKVESPKWGKTRTVPLATPAAAELARLSERGRFVGRDDLVFCGPLGEHLDPSAVRRRYRRTQEAAGLRRLTFHGLRHSFGSMLVRRADTTRLKSWMGHSRLTTTERYLHAKPHHSDADLLDSAFRGVAQEAEFDGADARDESPARGD